MCRFASYCLVACAIVAPSCGPTNSGNTDAFRPDEAERQERKPAGEESVLRQMVADVLQNQVRETNEHFALDQRIGSIAYINGDKHKWPECFQNNQVYDSTESLFKDRASHKWPIIGIRLDEIDLASQGSVFFGNCRITVVIINSDDFPQKTLSFGYGAEKVGDSWKVKLLCIE